MNAVDALSLLRAQAIENISGVPVFLHGTAPARWLWT